MTAVQLGFTTQITEGITILTKKVTQAIEIKSTEDLTNAHILSIEATKLVKQIGEHRLNLTRPLDAKKTEIMNVEKDIVKPLNDALKLLADAQLEYNRKIKEEADKQQKQLQLEADAERVRLEKLANQDNEYRQKVATFETQTAERIAKANTIDDLNKIMSALDNWHPTEAYFGKFVSNADSAKWKMKGEINKKIDLIKNADQDPFAGQQIFEQNKALSDTTTIQKQLELDTQIATIEIETQIEQNVAVAQSTIQKTVGMRKVMKYEITDANQIPIGYLCPDEKKIAEAVKNGVTEIAGVRIFEDLQRTGR